MCNGGERSSSRWVPYHARQFVVVPLYVCDLLLVPVPFVQICVISPLYLIQGEKAIAKKKYEVLIQSMTASKK